MPYDHKIPTVLNPSGDIVVPLYIPHDPQYTALLLGVLITLEEVDRYERDPNFDDENAQIVAANWRDRTITPLIEAIATGNGVTAYRLIKHSIFANFTTNVLTFVPVTNSGVLHTFTHPNARIRAYNISAVNNTGAQSVLIYPEVQGILFYQHIGMLETIGIAQKEMTAIIQYANLPVGLAQTIRLMAQVTGGTGTVFQNSHILYEIEEWP
jgi:hypothetical protein